MVRALRILALGLLAATIGGVFVVACNEPAQRSPRPRILVGVARDGPTIGTPTSTYFGTGPQPSAGSADCVPTASWENSSSASGAFVVTFDGAPDAPEGVCKAKNWDIQVHSRDSATWESLEEMEAQHGPDCSAPPASHHLDGAYSEAVFQCRDHIMTSISAGGYGVIYITPNRMVDWSSGEAVVSFDVSTMRTSRRDWWDLWLTPWETNLALPLDEWLPDLQGPPAGPAVHIRMDSFGGGTGFRVFVNDVEVNSDSFSGYEQVLEPSPSRRDTFELHLSANRISFGMPKANLWWAKDVAISNFGFSRGVLQLGHHSYNPSKADEAGGPGTAGTWHWDNLTISRPLPFRIVQVSGRNAADGESITLVEPAEQHAYLRFSAICAVWLNGAEVSPQVPTKHEEHFNSYFVPIPEGTRAVQFNFRPDNWYEGPCLAKDMTVWSLGS